MIVAGGPIITRKRRSSRNGAKLRLALYFELLFDSRTICSTCLSIKSSSFSPKSNHNHHAQAPQQLKWDHPQEQHTTICTLSPFEHLWSTPIAVDNRRLWDKEQLKFDWATSIWLLVPKLLLGGPKMHHFGFNIFGHRSKFEAIYLNYSWMIRRRLLANQLPNCVRSKNVWPAQKLTLSENNIFLLELCWRQKSSCQISRLLVWFNRKLTVVVGSKQQVSVAIKQQANCISNKKLQCCCYYDNKDKDNNIANNDNDNNLLFEEEEEEKNSIIFEFERSVSLGTRSSLRRTRDQSNRL